MLSISPVSVQNHSDVQTLLNGPAASPPPGITPNFVNPPNRNTTIVATVVICLTIATLAVSLRLYTKLFLLKSSLLKSKAAEDYLITVALMGHIAETVAFVKASMGKGIHMWDIRLKDFIELVRWTYIGGVIYTFTVCLIKISILIQYLRIFSPKRTGQRKLYIAIQAALWIIPAFYIIDTSFVLAICKPREKYWNPLVTNGSCIDVNMLNTATTLFNVVSDVVILVIPVIPVLKLQIPLKKKIMTLSIFGFGITACTVSAVRTYYSLKAPVQLDASYVITKVAIWAWVEVTVGILISCLPTLPKFFAHYSSKLRGTLAQFSRQRLHSRAEGTTNRFHTQWATSLGGGRNQGGSHKDSPRSARSFYGARPDNGSEFVQLNDLTPAGRTVEPRATPAPTLEEGGPSGREGGMHSRSVSADLEICSA